MTEPDSMADLLRTWKPPAGLSASPPRDIRLSGAGVILIVAIAIIMLGGIAAGIALGFQAQREARQQEQLGREGVEGEAVITRLWQTRDKNRRPRVSYQFHYNGVIYGGESEPPRAIWRELRTGSTLAIRFLPSAPEVSQPVPWRNRPTPMFLAVFVGLFLSSIGALLTFPLRQQRRLLREGRAAPAIVTGYSRVKNGRLLRYQFPLLNGSVIRAKGAATRNYPETGSTICVLYDRDNPRRSAPYPLTLVNVANPGAARPRRL
jgi:Protein of unknown function (DUF3592)